MFKVITNPDRIWVLDVFLLQRYSCFSIPFTPQWAWITTSPPCIICKSPLYLFFFVSHLPCDILPPSLPLCVSSFPSADSIDFWHSWCFPRPHYWQPLCVPFQYRMPFFFEGTLHPHTTHTQQSLTAGVTCNFTNGINVWWAFLDTKCPNRGLKQQHVVWKHFCCQVKFQCWTVKTSFLKFCSSIR